MVNQYYIFRLCQRFIQFLQTPRLPGYRQPFNRQRRFILLMLATTLVASACGSNTTQTNNQSETSASQTMKRVKHALGETEVPVNPTRIVVLDLLTVEAIMSLGVQPIAAPKIVIDNLLHLPPANREIADIGNPTEPNIEKILALKPDLILTSKIYAKPETYKILSAIAPTVVFDVDNDAQWQKLTPLCAEVLGKQAEAEKLLTDYEAKLQKLKTQLSNNQRQIKVSVVFFNAQRIWAVGKDTFSGSVLETVGLSRPLNQTEGRGSTISAELLSEIDGDALFVLKPKSQTKIADDVRKAVEKIKQNPLWSKLKVVQTNQVHEVDAYWYGVGYIAANLVLDDLFKYLVKEP